MSDTRAPEAMPIGRRDRRAAPPLFPPADAPLRQADAVSEADGSGRQQPAVDTTRTGTVNPITQWWQHANGDAAIRKARGGGRPWAMRWMREQPTSVHDLIDYYLNCRDELPGGRRGWGLRTSITGLNNLHAALYIAFGLTWALACTLALYALAWMQQRPGRALLFVCAFLIVRNNLDAWHAGS